MQEGEPKNILGNVLRNLQQAKEKGEVEKFSLIVSRTPVVIEGVKYYRTKSINVELPDGTKGRVELVPEDQT